MGALRRVVCMVYTRPLAKIPDIFFLLRFFYHVFFSIASRGAAITSAYNLLLIGSTMNLIFFFFMLFLAHRAFLAAY